MFKVSEIVCFEIACVLLKLKSLHIALSNCRTGSMQWTVDVAMSFLFNTSKMRNTFSDLSVTEREMFAVRPGDL